MSAKEASLLAEPAVESPDALRDLLRCLATRTSRYDFTVWFWGDAIAVDGLLDAAELLGDASSLACVDRYLREWVTTTPSWNDHLTPGRALLRLFELSGDDAFLDGALRLADWLVNRAPHTRDGLPLYRPDLPPYRHAAWVDTLYHEPPFFAHLARITDERKWLDVAVSLWHAHTAVLARTGSPILGHSYDAGAGLLRGHGWGRGNGWASLGIVDTLDLLPSDHPGFGELRSAAAELCAAVLPLQDPSGFWHTLLDDRDAYLEASTAAFFGATFEKAQRLGLVDGGYRAATEAAWRGFLGRIDDDGSFWGVSACTYASVHPDDDIQMYKTLPTEVNVWGQGAALRFVAERLRTIERETR